jgi:tRNA-specific 2-thiouridylase
MRNGVHGVASRRSCCSLSDARDARAVADRLGIPFYVHDLQRPFAQLMRAFAEDYAAGLTPNPCVVCNNELKFGELLVLADDLGCDAVATGHYARAEAGALRRAADAGKDQSYLLHGLSPAQLARARFPLGAMSKPEVRAHARRLALPVADKPDSADICFVPGGDYRAVVDSQLGGRGAAGALLGPDGAVVGQHGGVAGFTVGQRRGLGVALGHPVFVTDIDPEGGTVRVGPRESLLRSACEVGPVSWLGNPLAGRDSAEVLVQLRHHHAPERAVLRDLGPAAPRCVSVRFEAPSEAVCPGQYAAFYEGDRVLGGGRIRRSAADAVVAAGAAAGARGLTADS